MLLHSQRADNHQAERAKIEKRVRVGVEPKSEELEPDRRGRNVGRSLPKGNKERWRDYLKIVLRKVLVGERQERRIRVLVHLPAVALDKQAMKILKIEGGTALPLTTCKRPNNPEAGASLTGRPARPAKRRSSGDSQKQERLQAHAPVNGLAEAVPAGSPTRVPGGPPADPSRRMREPRSRLLVTK